MRRAFMCLMLAPLWAIACAPTPTEDLEAAREAVLQANIDFAQATAMSDAEGNRDVTRGRYVTVWRKQADGSWKVALDLGNTEPDGQE